MTDSTRCGHTSTVDGRDCDTRPLKVLQAIMRALSHSVRTPLSVVQNDLSYFSTVKDPLPPSEFARGIERCRQISELLRSATPAPLEPVQACTVPGHNLKVLAHPEKLSWSLAQIETLANETCSLKLTTTANSKKDWVYLTLTGTWKTTENLGEWDSLTGYFSEVRGLDKLSPPLIDAYVWAIGGSILLTTTSDRFEVTLKLPAA